MNGAMAVAISGVPALESASSTCSGKGTSPGSGLRCGRSSSNAEGSRDNAVAREERAADRPLISNVPATQRRCGSWVPPRFHPFRGTCGLLLRSAFRCAHRIQPPRVQPSRGNGDGDTRARCRTPESGRYRRQPRTWMPALISRPAAERWDQSGPRRAVALTRAAPARALGTSG